MQNIDLSILQQNPKLDKEIVLEIEPLAPLSMVSELPGSYYQTLKIPNKKMLCGLFENLLGWHIDLADRKKISKDVKDFREKRQKQQKKQKESLSEEKCIPFTDNTKGSTFVPLLMDYFEIKDAKLNMSKVVFYDDLWSKAFRRSDAVGSQPTHAKGTFNIDYSLISAKRELPRDAKNKKQIDNTALGNFYGENKEKFPFYYSTPTNREYIDFNGTYVFNLKINNLLFALLNAYIKYNNICYLGNSEGWINIKIS